MLVGRRHPGLSGHKLRMKTKKSQAPSEADLSRRAVEGTAVQRTFRGNVFRELSEGSGALRYNSDRSGFVLQGD